jgi:hypothetical protein
MNNVSRQLCTKSQVLRILDVVAQPGARSEWKVVLLLPAAKMIDSRTVGPMVGLIIGVFAVTKERVAVA